MALGSKKDRKPRVGALERRLAPTTRAVSDAQEARAAERYGGSVQRGSGATERHKGDVVTRDFLIEAKTKMDDGARSMTVKAEWLEKITAQAMAVGKDPAIEIRIPGVSGLGVEQDWVMVPASIFADLISNH